jgi:subtilisin-like proprotein convertase family protein
MKPFAASTIALCLIASPALASTFNSTDVPKPIPDNNATGISSIVNVSGIGSVTDVNLVLSDLQHTSIPDLHIELQAPDGTQTVLMLAFTEGGILTGLGTPDNFTNTVFDDQAATNLRDGTAPWTGSFNVNFGSILNPLSSFNGLNGDGVWTLFVSDRANVDVGSLNAWGLEITGNGAVPEPATWALALIGFGVAGSALRRRRLRLAA